MKLTDFEEYINAALEMQQDVFLSGISLPSFGELSSLSSEIKTVVLLPSKLYPSSAGSVTVFDLSSADFSSSSMLCLADVRLMKDERFCRFLSSSGFRRMIIPFAELSDDCAYGYNSGYLRAGQWRSETLKYCQAVCLFTDTIDPGDYEFAYSGNGTLYSDFTESRKIRAVKCDDELEKFSVCLKEATKNAGQSSLIFFNTRTEANDFSSFCRNNGRNFPVITGETTSENIKFIAASLLSGKIPAVAGTKSMLSLFPLINADKIFFCGVPFSVTHLHECFLCGEKYTVFFTENDCLHTEKLTRNFVERYRPDIARDIMEKRKKSLIEIRSLLGMDGDF